MRVTMCLAVILFGSCGGSSEGESPSAPPLVRADPSPRSETPVAQLPAVPSASEPVEPRFLVSWSWKAAHEYDQLLTGDFNGDGRTDAVAFGYTRNGQEYALPLLVTGDEPPVRPGAELQLGFAIESAAVGDFDGDGHVDVAVNRSNQDGTGGNSIVLLRGSGSGTFAEGAASSAQVFRITSADFDGDGALDLLGTTSAGIRILRGRGDGTFEQQDELPLEGVEHSEFTVAADLNQDRLPDAVVFACPSGYCSSLTFDLIVGRVFLNAGGRLAPFGDWFHAGYPCANALITDANGDGLPDLVLAADSLALLPGKGDGSWIDRIAYPPAGVELVGGDFNGDGARDVCVANGRDLTFLLGPKGGAKRPSYYLWNGSLYVSPSIAAIDANGDGLLDLLEIAVRPYDSSGNAFILQLNVTPR